MNNTLIAYFSASGVTKNVAEKIQKVVGGYLFEIEPVNPYTKEDLDWTNNSSRSSIEMNDLSFRPPVLKRVEDANRYERVLLGFPVWWYTAPTIINTFIEENDLTNKKIYVFVTSGSSSSEKSFNDLKNKYPNLNFIRSIRLTQSVTEEDIKNLLNS